MHKSLRSRLGFGQLVGVENIPPNGSNYSCMLANLVKEVAEVTVSVRRVRRQLLVVLAQEASRHSNALKHETSKLEIRRTGMSIAL